MYTFIFLSLYIMFTSLDVHCANPPCKDYFAAAEHELSAGNAEQAIQYFKKVLEMAPNNPEASIKLGMAYYSKNQFEDALNCFQKSLNTGIISPQLHLNSGLCFYYLNRYDEAIKEFEQAIALMPDFLKAYYYLGKILQIQNNHQQAIETFKQALSKDTNSYSMRILLGYSYDALGELEHAIEQFRIVHNQQPDNIGIMADLANLLTRRGYFDEAIELFNKILTQDPNRLSSLYNLAYTLKKQGNIQQAINILKTVLEKDPNHSQAQFALGFSLLHKGDFEQGWKQHNHFLRSTYRYTPALKEWIGNGTLQGKKILIRHEGGLGDSIQFIRYAQELKNMGAITIVACPAPLLKLYRTCPYIDRLIDSKNSAELSTVHVDAQATVMTLPALFNSNETTIPRNIPYIFPDETLSAYWKSILGKDKNLKVGICWQAAYNNPPNYDISSRSIPFETIAHIGTIPGVTLYALQKDACADLFKDAIANINITFFDQDFDTSHGRFMDTAAVIQHLDLVISVDTSIAHLAGALGRPVWLLLNYAPMDWRWIHMRTDSPWYPTLRVFQQPAPFDWESVIDEVIRALAILVPSGKEIH